MDDNKDILFQCLWISFNQDAKGNQGLSFRPAPLYGGIAGATTPLFVSSNLQIIQNSIQQVRNQIQQLTALAAMGKQRGQIGIEQVAEQLSSYALPKGGFASIFQGVIHPQLDLIQDPASVIPWEVLQERYYKCPKGGCILPYNPNSSYCSKYGVSLESRGGKLALSYHLTYRVTGKGRVGGKGKKFLLIDDPTKNLGNYRQHINILRRLLRQQGYITDLITQSNATINRVLKAITDPEVVGMYYFGHGYFPRNSQEGYLELADGPLFASNIDQAQPTVKFVFLNACQGAFAGGDWDIQQPLNSVAHALGRGSGKVVIAPLFPVVSVQAAETAVEFFEYALQKLPACVALQKARQSSFEKYESGQPHISWFAYRYFGDPNKILPEPIEPPSPDAPPDNQAERERVSRVFDENGKLNTDIFAFTLDQVLLRATKRRNNQKRTRVTVTDFLAGMIRVGDLTRFVLKQLQVEPDQLYKELGEQVEQESTAENNSGELDDTPNKTINNNITDNDTSGKTKEMKLRELLSKWVIRDKEKFTPTLVELLVNTDIYSQQRDPDRKDQRISEQEMLESLIADPTWDELNLPSASNVQTKLQKREEFSIDENGTLTSEFLESLDTDARKIIENAHNLAQKLGAKPIPNRIMLAAFLCDKESYLAQLLRKAGISPTLLFISLLIMSDQGFFYSFGLSIEACERIVLPVIQGAKLLTSDSKITEQLLLKAFCMNSNADFKNWLKNSFNVDLDKMSSTEHITEFKEPFDNVSHSKLPDVRKPLNNVSDSNFTGVKESSDKSFLTFFDDTVKRIIKKSAEQARLQGWTEIRSPHLFAGMIGNGSNLVDQKLLENQFHPEEIKHLVLRLVPPKPLPEKSDLTVILSKNVQKLLTQSIGIAQSIGHTQVTEEDLFKGFFADGGGVVGELLHKLGINF